MRALRYALEEAVASIWRARQSGLLSTATIALALFVLGAFLLVTSNLQRLGDQWSRAAEMSVYLDDGATPADRREIEAALAPGGVVASSQYVTKGDALVRFKQTFGDLGAAVDASGENPLPASYEVRLRTGTDARAGLEPLVARIRQLAGVTDVRYDRQWLDRLLTSIEVIRGVGFLLGSVLAIAAALTVANVVRLALFARRDELEIMQLVGAPQVYVRGPFVMEGILQGGTGAALALVALLAGFVALRARYAAQLASVVDMASIHFLPLELSVLLIIGGMAVGCVGGLIAAWNR